MEIYLITNASFIILHPHRKSLGEGNLPLMYYYYILNIASANTKLSF